LSDLPKLLLYSHNRATAANSHLFERNLFVVPPGDESPEMLTKALQTHLEMVQPGSQ
jgi:hypothetical protein